MVVLRPSYERPGARLVVHVATCRFRQGLQRQAIPGRRHINEYLTGELVTGL